jgi:aspartate aminotransferase-like enzyme
VADVVTALGVHPLHVDRWGLAAAVAGSQKGLMAPPGLAFVVLSEAGWERAKTGGLSRFYLDLRKARASLNTNSTPFTPAVPLVLAVQESLRLIEKEGTEAVFARHARHAQACRAAAGALGLELFSERPSNGLTAIRAPEDADGQEVVKALRERFGMRIAGGQEPMKGKLFRLGHMGYYRDEDILDLAEALEAALHELKWTEATGARKAADEAFASARGETTDAVS